MLRKCAFPDTLFLRSKLIFTFESVATYKFLYMKVASFN